MTKGAAIHIKPGVDLDGLRAVMWDAAAKASAAFDRYGYQFVITSGLDGKHSANSLHYKGLALDIRSRHIAPQSAKLKVLAELQAALGKDFDVILEADHYHVEYDPEEKGPGA